MPDEPAPQATLTLLPDRSALCVGDCLRGLVELHLPRPARLDLLEVTAAGREVIKTIGRFTPPVYRQPVPRPCGRTRTGTADVSFSESTAPLTTPVDLAAGRHLVPFALRLPADALPTYGGATVVVEHELTATARLDGRRLEQWLPLHLWRHEPVSIARHDAAPVVITLDGPVEGTITLPHHALALGQLLDLDCRLERPEAASWRRLIFELHANETTRHLAATDVSEYLAARYEVVLPPRARFEQRVVWPLPQTLAPTLVGRRFTLGWRLHVAVTRPWRLGAHASAPVKLFDPA